MLPREVLSSTSCICRIFNSEQKKAVVIDEDGREIEINDVTKETLSKYVNVDRSERNIKHYKTVDIYWPVPMLKVIFNFLSLAIKFKQLINLVISNYIILLKNANLYVVKKSLYHIIKSKANVLRTINWNLYLLSVAHLSRTMHQIIFKLNLLKQISSIRLNIIFRNVLVISIYLKLLINRMQFVLLQTKLIYLEFFCLNWSHFKWLTFIKTHS